MQKIKRNKRMFRKKRNYLKPIIYTVACALLIFVGYSVAGPIVDLFSGKIPPAASPSSSAISSDSSNDIGSSSSSSQGSSADSISNDKLNAVWIPVDEFAAGEIDQVIRQVKDSGANTIVVELKDDGGSVRYASGNAQLTAANAIAGNAYDGFEADIKKLNDAGIKTIASMHCFKDPKAHTANSKMAVLYAPDPSYIWLDNAPTAGGKSWLNPYSSDARDYLISIAKEIKGLGFDMILLESVQFPNNNSSKASFGADANAQSRSEILTQFIKEMNTAVEAQGGQIILSVPAFAAVGEENTIFGGNPLDFGAKYVAVNLRVSDIPGNLKLSDEKTLTNPMADVYDTILQIGTSCKEKIASTNKVTLIPWIQAEDLSSTDFAAQLGALESLGIDSKIYFNAKGDYADLTGSNN